MTAPSFDMTADKGPVNTTVLPRLALGASPAVENAACPQLTIYDFEEAADGERRA